MKHLKMFSKQAERFRTAYVNSDKMTLRDCYKQCSIDKVIADKECRREMAAERGWCYKIISYNTFHFTAAWLTEDGMRIETPSKSYIIDNLIYPSHDLPF